MEQHGANPQQSVIAVIPARYASTRLPGKLLLDLGGKPVIVRTVEQVLKSQTIDRTIVATDDERIARVVSEYGFEAVMTAANHESGTDRIAEVARRDLPEASIIVNVQGDEPMISPKTIDLAVSEALRDSKIDIVTTCERIRSAADVISPNVVKVVVDDSLDALYFSRSPIPYPREAVARFGSLERALSDEAVIAGFRKHTGLYVFRRESLIRFAALPPGALERSEMLEQLRALAAGARIRVVETNEPSVGIDTPEDIELARALFI